MCLAASATCRCDGAGVRTFLHMHAYLCLCASVAATRTPAGDTWPRCCCGLCCECLWGWQREGRPSLWLTQAERGFLHIFCGAIWALVSVAAPLRTHLAAQSVDGHLLFQPPGEERKQP